MLRIILWKLGFEWQTLMRILFPDRGARRYYFAFGANLSPEVLKCRRIQVFESFDYCLEGAALRFSQTGFYRNHGYASADAGPDSVIYGRMYLISQADAARMDYYEGVPFLQVHEPVFRTEDEMEFFYYRARDPQEGLKPTAEYLDYLVSAYREMDQVPQPYVDTLARTEVLTEFLPQDRTGDFVRDIARWPEALHPLLVRYEGWCLRVVEFFWNRSLFHWLIRIDRI